MSTLYRKYRPKTFSEIQGQTHIIRTLRNAIANDRIGHAYLFTGPRGTGKTTLARLFAKTVNCLELEKSSQQTSKPANQQTRLEPCNKCENCKAIMEEKAIDIVEIDAASHTGVDNIRRLKESVVLPPTMFKYKVYIIDEVHMLSIGAFNALLKTLEEPPAHAIFILATTELHKVPETIISRCQRFDISHLSQDQIIERLRQIAKNEKVDIEDEALESIALEAEGGMRDAESLLGQIISLEDKKITAQEVNDILGTSSKQMIEEFAEMLSENQLPAILEKLDSLQKEGVNLKNFNKSLLSYFRSLVIIKTSPAGAKKILSSLSDDQFNKATKTAEGFSLSDIVLAIDLLQRGLEMFKKSSIPQLPLEMALIEYDLKKNPRESEPEAVAKPEKATEKSQPKEKKQAPAPPAETSEKKVAQKETVEKKPEPAPEKKSSAKKKKSSISLEEVMESWSKIIEDVRPHNHSIHAFLENCTPCGIKDNTLYIKTKYDFYKGKLSESNNRLTVQKVVGSITNTSLKISFLTEKECAAMSFASEPKKKEKRNVLHDAMNVLGGKITKS